MKRVLAAAVVLSGSLFGFGCSSAPGDAAATDVASGVTSTPKTCGGSAHRACAAGFTCVVPAHHTVGACKADATTDAGADDEDGPAITSSFVTPSSDGQGPVIDAINGAASSIRMIMFHLTTPAVVSALVAAANRGVDVEMILDNENLADHTPASVTNALAGAGITVIPSSTGFRITHVKSLVIDNSVAVIMSMNLTTKYGTTRDYGVTTTDPGVVQEFLTVYAADKVNAQNGTANTPALSSPYLAWSPINSESRLAAFVDAATTSLVATSENLGDPLIQQAFVNAAARGVDVRIIAPLCDQNDNPLYDLPYLAKLIQGGVEARAMPSPATADEPYMHAKMMIADGARAFVGSVNFSTASTTDARELGIFFSDGPTIAEISSVFEKDWTRAVVAPAASMVTCPAVSE